MPALNAQFMNNSDPSRPLLSARSRRNDRRTRNWCFRVMDYLTPSFLRSAPEEDFEIPLQVINHTSNTTWNGTTNGGSTGMMVNRMHLHSARQLYSPALDQKFKAERYIEGNDYININPEGSELERYWQNAFKHIYDSHRPLQGNEYAIFFAALVVAAAVVSTSKAFGDRFIQSVSTHLAGDIVSTPEEIIEWTVALSNVFTQSSLTSKSFINVVCRMARSYNIKPHEFVAQLKDWERAVLYGVAVTGCASAKMIYDTWSSPAYNANLATCILLASLGFTSSVAVNYNFTYDRLLTFHDNRFDMAIIRMLTLNKLFITGLAKNADDPHLFIKALAAGTWFRQLNRVNNFLTAPEQAESTIRQLMWLTPALTAANANLFVKSTFWVSFSMEAMTSLLLGSIASTMNLSAGLGVPNFLFGLPSVHFIAYFANLGDQTMLSTLSLFLGVFVFGLSSFFVNIIINSRACQDLFATLRSALPDFINYGLDNLSVKERSLLFAIIFLTTGYAVAKAGQTLKYGLIDTPPFPLLFAFVTLIVCFGLGVMAMKGSAASLRNRLDSDILQKALAANSLEDFYYSPTIGWSNQQTLRRLLENNYNLSIQHFYDFVNQTKPDYGDKNLLSEDLFLQIEQKFGVNASPKTPQIVEVFNSPGSVISTPSTDTSDRTSPLLSSLFGSPALQTPQHDASKFTRGYGELLFATNSPAKGSLSVIPLSRQPSDSSTNLSSIHTPSSPNRSPRPGRNN